MYKINGKKELSGKVKISGSKNAVLPIIAASLLIKGKVTLKNVPNIGDVPVFLNILAGVGVKSEFNNNTLVLDAQNLNEGEFDLEEIKKIRVSILLLAPLLNRLGKISIPTPGGDKIGKRPIEAHLNGLKKIGYNFEGDTEHLVLSGKAISGNITLNAGFGVTPTENLIVANVLREGETIIKCSAIEPHVMNLIDFLRKAGAEIFIRYDHTIIVNGVKELKTDFEFEIISDYLQSGTYAIIAALCSKDYLTIENARIQDLFYFFEKLREAGVRIDELENDTIRVYRCHDLKPVSIQTNIFPSFPTDLQSPFSILLTQANGQSRIHEIMFEGRLAWLVEVEKMGGHIANLNPHEAIVFGKTELKGTSVTSWDLRAGAAMVIAGLIAEGTTTVINIEYIERGYENFVLKLKELGADIEII